MNKFQEIKARADALRDVKGTPKAWRVAQQNDDYCCVETDDCAVANDIAYESDAKIIAAAPEAVADRAALLVIVAELLFAAQETVLRLESGDVEYDDIRNLLDIVHSALAKVQS